MVQYDHPWLSNNPVAGFGASLLSKVVVILAAEWKRGLKA